MVLMSIGSGLKLIDTTTKEVIDLSRPPGSKNKPKDADDMPPEFSTVENDAKAERSREKPLDGKMGEAEIQRGLATGYNMLHRLIHDDTRFTPGDFSEEADGLMELVNRSARWRIIFRLLGPLNAVGAMWEKVEGTILRARERKAQPTEQQYTQPSNVGVNGFANDATARPIFK